MSIKVIAAIALLVALLVLLGVTVSGVGDCCELK
jgi:hypothetical protein